jgi:5-methylcytosine-specific restriction endonuclease McrA
MKITWDNIDKFYITPSGNFRYNNVTYELKNECEYCGDPYFTAKRLGNNKCCSRSCISKINSMGEKNTFYGKTHSKESLEKMSGINHHMYGKKHTEETLEKISKSSIEWHSNNKHPMLGRYGLKNPNWKNGYHSNNIPSYNVYSHQLEPFEKTRRCADDENILEVRCTYCNKWYIPNRVSVSNRILSITGYHTGENRFYCSDECKGSCDIFRQRINPKGYKTNNYKREVQAQLRKLVLERDNWTCQKCNNIENLHCHHFEGIEINPIESADIDNCITLCKKCHKEVHKQDGCNMKKKRC